MQPDNLIAFPRSKRTPAQTRAALREHEHRELAREIARRMVPWLRYFQRNVQPAFVYRWQASQARELSRELLALARLAEKRLGHE